MFRCFPGKQSAKDDENKCERSFRDNTSIEQNREIKVEGRIRFRKIKYRVITSCR